MEKQTLGCHLACTRTFAWHPASHVGPRARTSSPAWHPALPHAWAHGTQPSHQLCPGRVPHWCRRLRLVHLLLECGQVGLVVLHLGEQGLGDGGWQAARLHLHAFNHGIGRLNVSLDFAGLASPLVFGTWITTQRRVRPENGRVIFASTNCSSSYLR